MCRPASPLVGLGSALAAAAVLAAGAEAQVRWRLELLDSAALVSARLKETSGIVASHLAPGVFWTHNDSGDGPFLYATDTTGRDLGAVRLASAAARDWEDVTAGPCVVVPGRCLYVADMGDNRGERRSVVLYRLREPMPPRGPSDTLGVVPLLDSLVFVYPDGPHDAEALVVTQAGGLFVFTKDRSGPSRVFRASASRAAGPRRLRSAGTLAMETRALTGRIVTGAALGPDDSLLAVRTYVSLHLFRLRADGALVPLSGRRGIPIPIVEPQGEAVTFTGPDLLVLTSERGTTDRALISRVRLRPAPEAGNRPRPH